MKPPGKKEDRTNSHSHSRVNVAGMGSQYGNSRASVSRASHTLLGKLKGPETNIIVFDENGMDVTPLSLLGGAKNANKSAAPGESSAIMRETVADVLNNLESLTASSWNQSGFGKSGMSQSSKTSHSETSEDEDDGGSSTGSVESINENDAGEKTRHRFSFKSEPQEIDPNKYVHFNLEETDTITLFDLPSLCVSNEASDEVSALKTANARYKELKSNKSKNDNFIDKSMQTFNDAKKNKDIQACAQKFEDAEVMVNVWSIYDAQNMDKLNDDKQKEADVYVSRDLIKTDQSIGSAILSNDLPSSNMINSKSVYKNEDILSETVYTSITASHNSDSVTANGQEPAVIAIAEKDISQLNQKNLLASLFQMEKAVISNIYEKKLISYRDIVDAEFSEEIRLQLLAQNAQIADENLDENSDQEDARDPGPKEGIPFIQKLYQVDILDGANFVQSLQLLWCYRCELTRGREVMNMAFNKLNEDILAVAYGKCSSSDLSDSGLILLWSIKNPEWPERQYQTNSPVTALDFAYNNPNLLAAGFQDGRVIIYDVRNKCSSQVLDAGSSKHHDPVWEMKWIRKESISSDDQEGECLVSVSTDGRITQWKVRKGLESTNLMLLKSINMSGSTSKTSSFISRQSGGLCFDFHFKDSNNYIVGTEDGFIHRCSSSYNEQYLDSYVGHTGPVYKAKWSPFLSNLFLSCSADWTIRLWNQENDTDLFKFQNGKDAITDIAWSPNESTIFGSVSSDGRLEIWNLQYSVLDPMIVQSVIDRKLTSINFAARSPVIVSGDNNGVVNVYKLNHKNEESKNHSLDTQRFEQQASLLNDIIRTKLTNI